MFGRRYKIEKNALGEYRLRSKDWLFDYWEWKTLYTNISHPSAMLSQAYTHDINIIWENIKYYEEEAIKKEKRDNIQTIQIVTSKELSNVKKI